MGVHYHADPVRAHEIDLARQDPRHYLCCIAPIDEHKPEVERLHLFLEKGYSRLETVFRESRNITVPREPMPMELWSAAPPESEACGLDLVGRYARDTPRLGFYVRCRVLSPEEVRRVALDIRDLDEDDVVAAGFGGCEVSYVAGLLRDAQQFTAVCAEAGYGILYVIG